MPPWPWRRFFRPRRRRPKKRPRSAGEVTFGLKGALYDADRFSVDTDKWFLWAAYKL